MKKKLRLLFILIVGVFNCLSVNAQTPVNSEQYKDAVSFLQGNGVYDRPVMSFFEGMRDYAFGNFAAFIYDAQGLACIFMLIFFSIKSYEMMSGDKQFEVMPLLRPFGLMMVIMWWGVFCRVVAYPTDLVAAKAEGMFGEQQDEINAMRFERAGLMIQVGDQLMTFQAKTEIAADEAKETNKGVGQQIVESVKGFFADNIYNPIVEMKIRMQTSLQLLLTQALELIGLWILRICVYIVFMLQIIYSTVLVILGPFSVAVSVLPAFRDAFSTWIARFVSVNLYVGIAYLILYIVGMLQKYAMQVEIEKYKTLLGNSTDSMEKMAWFAGNGILSFGLVIVTFLVGAIAITTVPSISTWIISTSGITSAASTAARSGSQVGRMASSAVFKR
ncbi:plasmid transfer protein (plasmid) [Mucilaginibacter robiniae]|uniref:Plasmid transfer protein n=1 Tax=Mucilaginibacter robiniae TaxID=2728022 RepID=A0A7L5E9Q4_9SPHI|nr:plasmid transfer protein [Mucilaginibacter robiniae]QJD98554.1 plasmid transfer protein [Mucilaginibacter robiniae]